MKKVYHLNLDGSLIEGAKYVLLPGDPFRVEKIANYVAEKFSTFSKKLAWKREFCSYLTEIEGEKVLVISTGIGGPSTSIAIEELAMLGLNTMIRVGTTGAIQPYIEIGDVIITSASVRLDGASTHYAPIEYPASSNYEVIHALREGAVLLGFKDGRKRVKGGRAFHVGITVSSDTFYPGQERYESYTGYVIRKFKGSKEEWEKLKCLNYEMETATLLTLCNVFGLRCGAVTGVINTRGESEEITESALNIGVESALLVAVEGMKILIKKSREER